MSDFNVGARKKMAARDNIFTITSVINEIIAKKQELVLSIFDYRQMFDALDVQKSMSELFELGIDNRDLCLLYKSNKEVATSVNTEYGDTEMTTIKNNNMQGDCQKRRI